MMMLSPQAYSPCSSFGDMDLHAPSSPEESEHGGEEAPATKSVGTEASEEESSRDDDNKEDDDSDEVPQPPPPFTEDRCVSVGSAGHPSSCGPACKYHSKSRGCKDGANCSHCHLCFWRAPKERWRTKTKSAGSTDEIEAQESVVIVKPMPTEEAPDSVVIAKSSTAAKRNAAKAAKKQIVKSVHFE
jgi:hypothetical protein